MHRDIQVAGIDTKALATLLMELNIARRNVSAYPNGHPVIQASLKKVIDVYAELMIAKEEIVIGITRDALMVEDVFLERSNLVYRDFASTLFERGIVALVLHRGPVADELIAFSKVLNEKREKIFRAGGIEAVWEKAGISSLGIRPIRYDLFSTTEHDSVKAGDLATSSDDLWERFTRGITLGILDPEGSAESHLNPELLAALLNQKFKAEPDHGMDYASTIADFIRQGNQQTPSGANRFDLPYDKIAAFVSKMNPELRRQFLNSTFDIKNSEGESVSELIIGRFSPETIIEILEELDNSPGTLPPVIVRFLQGLSRHSGSGKKLGQNTGMLQPDEYADKMRTIFKEHASEQFVPEKYKEKLHQMATSANIPLLDRESLPPLMETVDPTFVEGRVSDILMFLVINDPIAEGTNGLVENLKEMCDFFLQTGDYSQLLSILRQARDERIPIEFRMILREHFTRDKFLAEVLNGLHIWGKKKFREIEMIILEIWEPFIEVLLDRLAEEESMPLRRFLMDRLVEFGPAAYGPIIARLSDSRWYYLRNLVVMVRSIQDDSILESIRPLLHHPNHRVSRETLKTLLHFHDEEAEEQVIREMEYKNHEVRLNAIRLAGRSLSREILHKLIEIIVSPGFFSRDFEMKSAAVQALSEIGDVDVLPQLETVINSRNILRPALHNKFKQEIVRSLEKYPPSSVRPYLVRLAEGRGRIARQAGQLLKNIFGRQQ